MKVNNKIPPTNSKKSPFYQLYILLNTERGSVPLQRDKGLDPAIVDKPITVIRAGLHAELTSQIKKYVRGLELVDVECKFEDGGLNIECEVKIIE